MNEDKTESNDPLDPVVCEVSQVSPEGVLQLWREGGRRGKSTVEIKRMRQREDEGRGRKGWRREEREGGESSNCISHIHTHSLSLHCREMML